MTRHLSVTIEFTLTDDADDDAEVAEAVFDFLAAMPPVVDGEPLALDAWVESVDNYDYVGEVDA